MVPHHQITNALLQLRSDPVPLLFATVLTPQIRVIDREEFLPPPLHALFYHFSSVASDLPSSHFTNFVLSKVNNPSASTHSLSLRDRSRSTRLTTSSSSSSSQLLLKLPFKQTL